MVQLSPEAHDSNSQFETSLSLCKQITLKPAVPVF